MSTTRYGLRIDDEAVGAGTTVRFALLVILLLMSSTSMMLDVVSGMWGPSDMNGLACLLAAGADPVHSGELAAFTHAAAQDTAFEACTARYQPSLSGWVALGWPLVVLIVAVALFRGLPAWRRRRVVPLADVELTDERGGIISGELARLATTVAGLDRVPRFVVEPATDSIGAVVFGSNRRPTICLHGGLLAHRGKDPQRFRAIVLHEMAHVHNGDITVTDLTVAVWRVFVTMVLLPFVAWNIVVMVTGPALFDWPIVAPSVGRNALLTALMVTLVYLARSDVLRAREIYADLTAVRWGADRHGWAGPASPSEGGALRRALGSFVEVWRTHPRQELRRTSLADPAVLFSVQELPLFLTGAAAALVDAQATHYVGSYLSPETTHYHEVIAVSVGALVTAVAGLALWRAAAHSVFTGRQAPSGVRAGLWLGAGMTVATLVTDDVTSYQWLPSRPEVLLLVLGAGVVFAWWTTQCAHLWLRVWPGRTIRPAILLGLAGGCLVLSAWFEWWENSGSLYANGLPLGLSDSPLAPGGTDHWTATVLTQLDALAGLPLILPALTALWVMPLLVWVSRQETATPRWLRATQRRTDDPVPPLGRILRAALPGGLFGWIALAGVMAFLHATQPPSALGVSDRAVEVYVAWILVVWVAGMALAAVIASVVAGRFRLLAALVAAQTAGMVAVVGMFLLASFDGCLPPLNTMRDSCSWRPDVTWPIFSFLTGPAFVVGAVVAVMGAAAVSAVLRLRRPVTLAPRSTKEHSQTVRWLSAAALCVASVGLAAAGELSRVDDHVSESSAAVATVPVSTETRGLQVAAWTGSGGSDLIHRYITAFSGFIALLERSHGAVDASSVHAFCEDFGQIAVDADAYFQIPDPKAQSLWRTFIAEVRTIGQDCDRAVAQSDGDLLVRTADNANQAGAHGNAVMVRMNVVMQATDG